MSDSNSVISDLTSNNSDVYYGLMIYIKWLPTHYRADFIDAKFSSYGQIANVRFIPKQKFDGSSYNSAVVTFEKWFMSERVHKLFNDMADDIDGTAKFYYIDETGRKRFWHVKEYSPLFADYEDSMTKVYALKNSKDQYAQMDNIIKSMATQLHYYRTRNAKLEKDMVQVAHNDTIIRLQNSHLNGLIDERDRDMYYVNSKMRLLEMELSNERQQRISAEETIRRLEQEIKDKDRVLDYFQNNH